MIRSLYDWTLSLSAHPKALWALAFVAFIESSVFPIPPHVLIIPMVIAAPSKAWKIAFVATVASVLGGLLGYGIGALLFDHIGQPVLEFYGKAEKMEAFNHRFNEWGAWAVLVAGVTPFPYKVITIMSGWTGLSLPVFLISSIVARSLIFFAMAALLWKFGPPIKVFIEKYLGLLFTLFCVLLIGGFYVLRYI